jgi:O-antigen/teichoic acid export membrane protein
MSESSKVLIKFSKDVLIYLPSKVLPSIMGFVGLMFFTRLLNPDSYGVYSLVVSTVGILGVLTYGWIRVSALRFYQSYEIEGKLDEYFTNVIFLIVVCISITASLLLFVISTLETPRWLHRYWDYTLLLLITFSLFELSTTVLRADLNSKQASLLMSLSSFYVPLSIFLFYILNPKVDYIFGSLIVTNLLLFIYAFFNGKFYKYIKLNKLSVNTTKNFVSYGIPAVFALISSWVLSLSDRYMISIFRNTWEVGIYSAVYQLSSYPFSFLSSLFVMASLPMAISLWEKEGKESAGNFLSKVVKYYLALGLPLLFGLFVLAKPFAMLLGSKYIEGYIVMPWIFVGSFFLGLSVFVGNILELEKKTKVLAYSVGISAVFNLTLNLIAVPKFGYYGAGMTTCVSYILYFVILKVKSDDFISINTDKWSILKSLISSALMALILLMINPRDGITLIISVIMGMMLYFASMIVMGEFKDEIKFMLSNILR